MKSSSRIEQLEARQLMSVSLSAGHNPIITPLAALTRQTVVLAPVSALSVKSPTSTSTTSVVGPMLTTSTSTTTTSSTSSSTANKTTVSPLAVTFDSSGLASITYNGTKLYDGKANPMDRYLVGNYGVVNPDGSITSTYGGNPLKTSWNASTLTLTTTYAWGTVACQYTTASDRLTMKFTVTNTSTSNIAGVNINPVALRFPIKPAELKFDELGLASLGPPAVSADFGTGMVAVVGEDVSRDEYIALSSSGSLTTTANRYLVRIGSMAQTQPSNWPVFDRPISPGGTDTYTASLRFAPTKTALSTVASDVYSKFSSTTPFQLNWTDRRPIAELMPASEGHRTATNPRGWIFGSNIDVTTPAGLANFRQQLLTFADQSVAILKNMNAQGMITWDIEGEQFPTADYIGDPRFATTLAPEMAYQNTINDYFKKFSDAGLRVGVTIRANEVVMNNGVPTQINVPDSQLAQLLIDKINYARQNWGATLFYIDSTLSNTLSTVFATIANAEPGVLLIPENTNTGDFAYTAPYREARQGLWSTPAQAKALYAGAFSIINSVDVAVNSTSQSLFNSAVKEGDILLFQGWWNNPSNALVKAAYQANATKSATTVSSVSFSTTSIVPSDSVNSTTNSDWLKSAA